MLQKKKILALSLTGMTLAVLPFMLFEGGTVNAAGPPAGQQAPQAMPVKVTKIKSEPTQIWKKFSGHLIAVDQVEIRPQVSGRITEIRFKDGQHVEKGDILFVIDPRPYEATLNQAKAALAAAQTQSILAEKEYKRGVELVKTEAIPQRVLDERANNRQIAQAAIKGAQATIEKAQIDLDYAYVKTPISGTVGRREITEGNLVQSGPNAPLLTTVVADEEIYADFEVDEQTYIGTVRQQSEEADAEIPVLMTPPNSDMVYKGRIYSFDNKINQATGTIRARALFENENKILLSGMSVGIMMGNASLEKKILLTERAIGTDQDRKFVYVITKDNKAAYREVKIGDSIEGKRVILSGLNEGEMVIVEGIVRIRPDMPVTPQVIEEKPAADNSKATTVLIKKDDPTPDEEPDQETLEQ